MSLLEKEFTNTCQFLLLLFLAWTYSIKCLEAPLNKMKTQSAITIKTSQETILQERNQQVEVIKQIACYPRREGFRFRVKRLEQFQDAQKVILHITIKD